MGERAWMCLKRFLLLSTMVNYRHINLHLKEYFETVSKHLIYANLRGQFAEIHCKWRYTWSPQVFAWSHGDCFSSIGSYSLGTLTRKNNHISPFSVGLDSWYGILSFFLEMGWLLGCNMWNCRPDQLSKPCVSEEGLVKQRINGSWLYPRMFTPRNSSNMFKCVWWRLGTGTLNFMMFLVKIYHAFVWGIFLGSCIFLRCPDPFEMICFLLLLLQSVRVIYWF